MEAYIKEIAYYLPERVVTNEELVKDFPEWSVEKIAEKVGVNERRVASEDETATDMAICAAEKLFEKGAVGKETALVFVYHPRQTWLADKHWGF